MASKFYFFDGTVKWAKLNEKNATIFNGPTATDIDKEKGPFCSVDFFFKNKVDLVAFRKLGVKSKIKLDEETGEDYVSFRRYLEHKTYPEFGGVPKVFLKTDDEKPVPYSGLIGNGSEATIKVCIYEHSYGVGCRLEGLLINKLVEFEQEEAKGPDSNLPNNDMPF